MTDVIKGLSICPDDGMNEGNNFAKVYWVKVNEQDLNSFKLLMGYRLD